LTYILLGQIVNQSTIILFRIDQLKIVS